MKLFRWLVVFVDRSAVGAGQLDRVGDNAGQDSFQIESRADRLANFAQRFQFTDRARQFLRPRLQFLKQPTFSIAITAWSAKVSSKAICLSVKRAHFGSADQIAPIATPSRSKRHGKNSSYPLSVEDLSIRKLSFDDSQSCHECGQSADRLQPGRPENRD